MRNPSTLEGDVQFNKKIHKFNQRLGPVRSCGSRTMQLLDQFCDKDATIVDLRSPDQLNGIRLSSFEQFE